MVIGKKWTNSFYPLLPYRSCNSTLQNNFNLKTPSNFQAQWICSKLFGWYEIQFKFKALKNFFDWKNIFIEKENWWHSNSCIEKLYNRLFCRCLLTHVFRFAELKTNISFRQVGKANMRKYVEHIQYFWLDMIMSGTGLPNLHTITIIEG